ncbi:bifunctional 2-polyprenyl-6-hydroxyphenol methylase/3-demethylubiquinol 3-O-methyltransferase UbiG [Streptacidiphilus sp. PB12-B1b]|uniref:class I SAM-dependent methyltransferase n=1 Tax=Streptacidiphilus sp. PB12-B1b TaxID=2705012 RepID=UPI001CDD34B3|nr:class I SAM-dependent methyltransferase [Streptacidiphilus sp. PB12-B1b]
MARQLAEQITGHFGDRLSAGDPLRVLDAGCGQGTQALRLARAGHHVTGLDPDPMMLGEAQRALCVEPPQVQTKVTLLTGQGGDCGRWFGPGSFDVVLCHGMLMFLPEPGPVLASLARMLAPGGMLSVIAANGDALAMRPGCAGDWAGALEAFGGDTYVSHHGVPTRADRLEPLTRTLAELSVPLRGWYGVRVFTDQAPEGTPAPSDPAQLARLLDAEEQAGRTDPYRTVAALLHLVGTRRS